MSAPPLILALDLSKTRTGIAEGRVGQTPRFLSLTGNDSHVRAVTKRLGLWLIARLQIDPPDFVFVEAAVNMGAFIGEYDDEKGKVRMKSSPDAILALSRLAGVAEFVADAAEVAAREAKIQTVRKAFIGHGNLPGDLAKMRVRQMCTVLGWNPANNDEADAGAVWWWAGTQVAPKFYQPITPMDHHRVASHCAAAEVDFKSRQAAKKAAKASSSGTKSRRAWA